MIRNRRVAPVVGVAVLAGLAWSALGNAASPDATEAALGYLHQNKQAFGLSGSDLQGTTVNSSVRSAHNGVTHVYLQQRYRDISVWNAIATVNVRDDGSVLSAGSGFASHIASAAGGQNARKSALDAAEAAAGHLKLKPKQPFHVVERKGGPSEAVVLSDGGIAAKPIEAQLVWLPTDGTVRLAWVLEIEEAEGSEAWYAFVDAETGESLGQQSLVVHDSAESIAAAVARPAGTFSFLASFPETDGASYRVYPIPLGSPTDGGRQLVTNAASPEASPFGWHDTNGVAGPEFTVTRGNNVHAYADRDANNVVDPGSDPDGGLSLTFDFPIDLASRPLDSQPAIVTNLFYWNNVVHDVIYNYGFDEAAGNFQVNNYGKFAFGANDDVRAEAQDGSGRNNANFFTPVDGSRPRMQMFEWRSAEGNPITVHEPSEIAGVYFGPMAGFGESLTTTGPLSGTVVYVDDGVVGAGTVNDGCEAFTINPGEIPMMDRGACNFTVKVKNAQDAGAEVAIVVNNIEGPPTAMGGTDNSVLIPSVMISLADGNLFKVNLPLDVTIADGTDGAPDRDSDLDAGIIAHEYGHGISNRLTGGRTTVSCLGNLEQMGEGWSDWFGITLTTNPSDTALTARGVGTYVSFQPSDGPGIRPTPYSTDMTVNPSTYASVADTVNISQPHGIGYVWNTMLWEVYWNLVHKHGYNANIYENWSTGGNNLAFQLVMDGMKIQPCQPGFVTGRNAILQADAALTGGANQCEIWRGFAKRGLGFSASQGSSNNRSDGVEAFDLPAACTAAVFGGFKAPFKGTPPRTKAKAGSKVPVKFELSGAAPTVDSQPVNCQTLQPTGEAPIMLARPGDSGFQQDGDLYQVNWATDSAWKGTCRAVTVRIPAESDAIAYVDFN